MVAIVARGDGRRRARGLDHAHPRSPHEPGRRGPGHVRRRGGAVRAGERAAGARHRRVRGRPPRHGRRGRRRRARGARPARTAGRRRAAPASPSRSCRRTPSSTAGASSSTGAANGATPGVPIYPQVANRATGILFGLQSRNNVFSTRPELSGPRRPPARGAPGPHARAARCARASWPSRTASGTTRWRRSCTRRSRTCCPCASRWTGNRPRPTPWPPWPRARDVRRRRSSTTSWCRATAATW